MTKHNSSISRFAFRAVCLAGLASSPLMVLAQTWSPPVAGGGSFHDPLHWSTEEVPGSNSTVTISAAGTMANSNNVITLEDNVSINSIQVYNSHEADPYEVTLDLGGHTFTVASDSTAFPGHSVSDGPVLVRIQNGDFVLQGDWRSGYNVHVANAGPHELVISNAFLSGTTARIGNNGRGLMRFEGGATGLMSSFFTLGGAAANESTFEITGPGTAVTNQANVTGRSSDGVITIRDQAHWQVNATLRIQSATWGDTAHLMEVTTGASVHANTVQFDPGGDNQATLHISDGVFSAGTLDFGATTTFMVTLHTGGTNSLLTTTGNATLTDAVFKLALNDGFDAATDGSVTFKIMEIGGTRTGSFLGLDDQGPHVISAIAREGTPEEQTYYFEVHYDNPGSAGFSLTVIPEPGALALLLVGFGAVLLRRRRA